MTYDFRAAFEIAVPYEMLIRQHANEAQAARWQQMYESVRLTAAQQALLSGFTRKMHVLCVAGVWCGDCVNACPIFQRFAEASPAIALRFVHRAMHFNAEDASSETRLMNELSICGGPRVPMLVFLSEDWYECERFGERTLATYRSKALRMEGLSCPIGAAPADDLLSANVAEWLEHFERVQLMLLTSPRLMALHG